MRLKPASDLMVRDPVTRLLLPAEGIDVPDTDGIPHDPHWRFMLRHEDVVAVKPEQPPSQDAAALPVPVPVPVENEPDPGPAGHDQ